MARGNTATLTPYNTETARAAGLKSAENRRIKREAERAAALETATAAQDWLEEVQTTFQREALGPAAAATAMQLMSRIVSGNIPVRHGGDAAELMKVLVDIARLEEGQATSHTLHGSIDAGILARIAEVQQQLTHPPADVAPPTIEATASEA